MPLDPPKTKLSPYKGHLTKLKKNSKPFKILLYVVKFCNYSKKII